MASVHVNTETFKKEVLESDIPVIVDFWAAWCGPCKMMGPVFEELSEEYKGKLKFAKLDTEADPAVAGSYGIMSIPSLLIFHKGKEANRLMGFSPKEVLKQKIDEMLGGME